MKKMCGTMKARKYEFRSRNADARVHRRTRSVPPVRRWDAPDSFRIARYDHAARTGVPQEGRRQPPPARAETEGQAFRFPRPCRDLLERLLRSEERRVGKECRARW